LGGAKSGVTWSSPTSSSSASSIEAPVQMPWPISTSRMMSVILPSAPTRMKALGAKTVSAARAMRLPMGMDAARTSAAPPASTARRFGRKPWSFGGIWVIVASL
jgi:hypothetical protein